MAVSSAMIRLIPCSRRLMKSSQLLMINSRSTLTRLSHTTIDFARDGDTVKNAIPAPDKVQVIGMMNCLRKDPKEAISLFSQVKDYFRHDILTYAKVIGMLCDSSIDEDRLNSALARLLGSEEEGSPSPPVFSLLDLIQTVAIELDGSRVPESPSPALTRAVNSLFKAYVSLGLFNQIKFAISWVKFVPLNVLDISSCNFLFKRLIEHGKEDSVVSYYELFKSKSIIPNAETYPIVARAHSEMGKFDQVNKNKLFDEMFSVFEGAWTNTDACLTCIEELCLQGEFELGYKMYSRIWRECNMYMDVFLLKRKYYKVLIKGLCAAGKFDDASDVLHDYNSAVSYYGVIWDSDADCYYALLREFCNTGNIEAAVEVYDGIHSRRSANGAIIGLIFQAMFSKGEFDEAVQFYEKYIKGSDPESGSVLIDGDCYNIVMESLCQVGQVEEAAELLNEMKVKHLAPDARHYTNLLKGYCRLKNIPAAFSIFEEMKQQGYSACQT